MFKLIKNIFTNEINVVQRLSDGACIPFAVDNSDYQAFKLALQNGVELLDDTGTPIDGKTFLQGLL